MLSRIRLILWAIRGLPIIYKVKFKGGIELDGSNRNVLIMKNSFIQKENSSGISLGQGTEIVIQNCCFNYIKPHWWQFGIRFAQWRIRKKIEAEKSKSY